VICAFYLHFTRLNRNVGLNGKLLEYVLSVRALVNEKNAMASNIAKTPEGSLPNVYDLELCYRTTKTTYTVDVIMKQACAFSQLNYWNCIAQLGSRLHWAASVCFRYKHDGCNRFDLSAYKQTSSIKNGKREKFFNRVWKDNDIVSSTGRGNVLNVFSHHFFSILKGMVSPFFSIVLRTVPPFVTAYTFCPSRDIQVS